MAKKSKKSETPATPVANANVVAGPRVAENTVVDQAREARGDEEKKEDKGGDASLKPSTFPNSDELAHRDEAKEARVEHLRSLGINDPENPQGDTGVHKVLPPEKGEKMYTGIVTVRGTDGQYGNPISTRIDCGPFPKGEHWLKNKAFKEHFPSADLTKPITIDPENKSDPLLRTQHG